ncbi:MAG: S-layer homology domain-containing protein [Firmicutes bacterium]|nr:S-layer homology domain-containing protein [Bacillota bacterium]
MNRRLLALLLTLCMVLSMVPATAFADGEAEAKPNATVEKLSPIILAGDGYMCWPSGGTSIDRPLDIVMRFKAQDTLEQAQAGTYGDWVCDFYVTVTGLAKEMMTADGDCYLAGNYGNYGWIVIPMEGLEIEEGTSYPVVAAYDANLTYENVCDYVKEFIAAIHISDEIIEVNPDLNIKLELKMTNPENETDVYTVGGYDYDTEDLRASVVSVSNGETETGYQFIAEAFENVKDGDIVTLLQDVEQPDGVTITDKNVTIDLDEFTFTVTEGASTNNRNFKIDGTSDVTIKNGTMVASGDYDSGAYGTIRTEGTAKVALKDLKLYNYRGNGLNIKAYGGTTVKISDTEIYSNYGGGIEAAGGEIELTNVMVEQTGMYTAPYNSMAISVNGGGKVVVNSGTYTTEPLTAEEANGQGSSHGSWTVGVLNSGGTLVINDGTFANGNFGDDSLATYPRGLVLADTGAVIEINGGTFNALAKIVDIQNNLGDASKNPKGEISGGDFSADPTNDYVTIADGYTVEENEEGRFELKVNTEEYPIAIGEKLYKTLEEAAADAKANDIITLLREIEMDSPVTLIKGKIVGNIHNAVYDAERGESDDPNDGELFYAPYQNSITSHNVLIGTANTPAAFTLDGMYIGAKASLLSGNMTVIDGSGLYGSDEHLKSWMNVNRNGQYTFAVGDLLVHGTEDNFDVTFDGTTPIAQLDLEAGAEIARFGHIYIGSNSHAKGENAYVLNIPDGAELKEFGQLTTRGDGTINLDGAISCFTTKSYQSSSAAASSMHENAKDGGHSNNNGVINVSDTGSIRIDSMNIGRKPELEAGNAELNIDGGIVEFSNYINVGYDGSARIGEMNLTNGAQVVSEESTYTLKYNNGKEAGITEMTRPAGTLTVGVAATGEVTMDTTSTISVGTITVGEHGTITVDATGHTGASRKIIEQTAAEAGSLEGKVTVENLPNTHHVVYEDGDVIIEAKEAVVTFVYNNGDANTSQAAICSLKIAKPADPAREGYVFAGWFTDAGLTDKYDFAEAVTDNITLYAKWNKVETPSRPSGGSSTTTTTPIVSTDDKTEENVAGDKVTTTETTAKPEATVTGTTAKTEISESVADQIVEQATKNESHDVIIAPEVSASKDVEKVEVTVDAAVVEKIGKETDANLTVSTSVADVKIENAALEELAQESEQITVSAEKKEETIVIEVKADDKAVSNVSGGLTVTVPVEETSAGMVAVIVHEDGTEEVVRQTVAGEDALEIPLDGSATIKIVDNSKDFEDVKKDDWHSDAVDFASSRELFNGTSATTFGPSENMTRGMLAVVLHNLESNPEHEHEEDFHDVHDQRYYADAVAWAAGEGLVSGYGNGAYGPDDHITRQQLAVILWKYAGCPDSDHELDFYDEDDIAGYAETALKWANEHKIINGKGGNKLDPTGNATRAEVAQMLKNFMENVK